MDLSKPILNFVEQRYRFLSNHYPCTIVFEGMEYPSVEHAYQAAKFTNQRLREHIANLPTAGKAKQHGRRFMGESLRPGWDEMRQPIMLQLLRWKFEFNVTLRIRLLATGDREIIEGNYWGDTYWGMYNGVGENHLGKLLMQVRREYRSG